MPSSRRWTRFIVVLAVAAGALVAPSVAQAGTVSMTSRPYCTICGFNRVQWGLQYHATAVSEVNTVTVGDAPVEDPRVVFLRDETAKVAIGSTSFGASCESKSDHEVWCRIPDDTEDGEGEEGWSHIWEEASLFLGDLDDEGSLAGWPHSFVARNAVDGGAGDDVLVGTDTIDLIEGGPGEDTVDGRDGQDEVYGGDDDDVLDGGPDPDLLDGGDGNDTMTYASRGADEPVSVRLDGVTNDGGAGEGGSADRDVSIERVVGGAGADTLVGDDGVNRLAGGAGNDVLEGRGGSDELLGGDGVDTVSYESRGADAPVAIRLDGRANDGADLNRNGYSAAGEEQDRDSSVENAIAGAGPDVLVGNAGENRLAGLAGDDVLDGGRGADALVGGAGSDRMTYAARTDGVAVAVRLDGLGNDGADPDRDGVSGPSEEGDQDFSIENATGAAGPDQLFGGAGANSLLGLAGHDLIDGGLGADTINGGLGVDTMSYAKRTGAVAIVLDGIRNDGADPDRSGTSSASEENDLDVAIENAAGGSGRDLIRSQRAAASVLTGNGGDDRMFARDGGSTPDTVDCGAGTDSFQVDGVDVTDACETPIP